VLLSSDSHAASFPIKVLATEGIWTMLPVAQGFSWGVKRRNYDAQ